MKKILALSIALCLVFSLCAIAAADDARHFEIVVKSYQSSYWQAAVKGIEAEAAAKGVTVHCTGPNTESDYADWKNMFDSAINSAPDGIGIACSTWPAKKKIGTAFLSATASWNDRCNNTAAAIQKSAEIKPAATPAHRRKGGIFHFAA